MPKAYIVARSSASYRIFLKKNNAAPFDFPIVTSKMQVHTATSGTIFIFLMDYWRTSTGQHGIKGTEVNRLLRLRPDLIRVRDWVK